MLRTFFLILLCFIGLEAHGQLVLPGDHPDPSVVKIGDRYWASATTSNWAPAFPLLSSTDLIHWDLKGYVFSKLPDWADYYFWAPEISYEDGKTYIYYSAHKKDGNLCLGIASADKPEGPYTDHGPVMCERVGSIDAFPMRDENGKLFLVWKEDGNSVGKPTPIWICEMKEDRTALIGEKVELFRNDEPWESNLVEGVSMIKHGEYYYAFYAAAGCCGKDCTYANGVARSKSLIGPWEKYKKNPILDDDAIWKCPGHGTPVEKDGKFYFLYHAYNVHGGVHTGRQGLLREFEFTPDGWVKFLPAEDFKDLKVPTQSDQFDSDTASLNWQWSVFSPAKFQQTKGQLHLFGQDAGSWTFLGQKAYLPNYKIRSAISLTDSDAEAGIAAIGDEKNMAGVSYKDGKIRVWKHQLGKDSLIAEEVVGAKEKIFFELKVQDGNKLTFRCSTNGKSFKTLNRKPVQGTFLPPWDRAVRVGLISRGGKDQKAVFENFILYH